MYLGQDGALPCFVAGCGDVSSSVAGCVVISFNIVPSFTSSRAAASALKEQGRNRQERRGLACSWSRGVFENAGVNGWIATLCA